MCSCDLGARIGAVLVLLTAVQCGGTGAKYSAAPVCRLRDMITDLRCTLSISTPERDGTSAKVTFTVENTSATKTFHILRRGTPLDGIANDVFIVRRRGGSEPVRYGGFDLMVTWVDHKPGAQSYATLAPGAVVSRTVDLIEGGYDMSAPGEYEIEYPGAIRDLYGGAAATDRRPDAQRRGEQFEPAILYCNRLIVRVPQP